MLMTCILTLLTLLVSPAYAENKTIISDATYSMGDGETPLSAEAMVLQKAKQRALEEAGTYVESYTHVRNLDLTVDEIKTIAGGVMKTEVIEQTRALEGNGTRFYIKIRAVITTDRIEDLARRKQLGPLSAENKKLQADLAKLTRDLEDFKRQIVQSKTESERTRVLDKIREVEKQFRHAQSTETTLYRRLILVSGEELSAQVDKAFREEQRRRDVEQRQQELQRESLERLLTVLKSHGHTITIGLPKTDVSLDHPDTVALRFIVTAEASTEAKSVIHDLHKAYNADLPLNAAARIDDVLDHLTLVVTVSLKDGREYVSKHERLHNYKSPRSYDLNQLVKSRPTVTCITIPIPRHVINQVASIEGKIEVQATPGTPRAASSAVPAAGERKTDMLRDLQLPPDAPRFDDLSPAKKIAAQSQQTAGTNGLKRSSVSEDLNRELEDALNTIKQFQPAAKQNIPHKTNGTTVQTPETTLKVSGPDGSSPYWGRVQSLIKSRWEPPPIDMAGHTYTMVVQFRIQRDGTITDVVLQQSSGNAYYDLAGQRAVLRPRALPPLPADMTDTYKDVEMEFRIGESLGVSVEESVGCPG
ncbi:MAG: TonB family protein [Nitrospira sp.]